MTEFIVVLSFLSLERIGIVVFGTTWHSLKQLFIKATTITKQQRPGATDNNATDGRQLYPKFFVRGDKKERRERLRHSAMLMINWKTMIINQSEFFLDFSSAL